MGHYIRPILTDQQLHLHRGLLASTLLQKHLIDSGIAELVFDHCVPGT